MVPLSLLLLLISVTAIVAAKEISSTDSDRTSHLEDVIKTLLERQEEERWENALQNKRIWNLEETMARYEEENKILKTENVELKRKLNQIEISVRKMDAHVKRLQRENLSLMKTVKSQAKIMNYIQFRILQCKKQKLKNSLQPEKLVSVDDEQSEGLLKFTESNVESKSLASSRKRLLTGIPTTPQPNGVAFSVYLKPHETHLTEHQTILFDGILTNIGNHYNPHTGAFTAPIHGVYVFTWNLYCTTEGYMHSEIAVNSNQIGSMFTSCQGTTSVHTTTGIIVAEINKDDTVLVRTHPSSAHSGSLYSHIDWRSTFSGWLLF